MFRNFISIAGIITFSFLPALGQTAPATAQPTGKDYTFNVSANGSWTNTGVDVEKGDVVQISPAIAGCAAESSESASTKNLPLASAPAGALIAKLAEGGAPVSFSASGQLDITEAGHLYLALNGKCPSGPTVKAHIGPMSQGDKLKQQLESAAQIWLQGQFGNEAGEAAGKLLGNTTPVTNPLTNTGTLEVSNTPLDPRLRKDIDGLPRRVNDQFKNFGDMVNFVLVGSESQVKSALDAANWHIADTNNVGAVVSAINNTYQNEDYLAMPMSTLYLFGRPQDYGYEMAEPIAMVASRHHFRLWKAPFTWDGQTVWAGAGTHDIGFAKDKRNGSITHKIDPNLDGERTNIGLSLDKAAKVKSMTYYLPPNPVQDAKNATGDSYTSDGRMLVVFLK
jgi:hypothetical protein